MKVLKLLYVEKGLHEMRASSLLEEITSKSQCQCIFTVVQNPYLALECTEHTEYDAIFIMNDSMCNLTAIAFLTILRNIGLLTPVILLHDKELRYDDTEPGFPLCGLPLLHYGPDGVFLSLPASPKFAYALKKPFTCRDLCLLIDQLCYQQHQQQHLWVSSSSSHLHPSNRPVYFQSFPPFHTLPNFPTVSAMPAGAVLSLAQSTVGTRRNRSNTEHVIEMTNTVSYNQENVTEVEQEQEQGEENDIIAAEDNEDKDEEGSYIDQDSDDDDDDNDDDNDDSNEQQMEMTGPLQYLHPITDIQYI